MSITESTSAVIVSVQRAFAFSGTTKEHGRWAAIDGEVLDTILALKEPSVHRLGRACAEWARQAHNAQQTQTVVWTDDIGASISVQSNAKGATDVTIHGGYAALQKALGSRRLNLQQALDTLGRVQIRIDSHPHFYTGAVIQAVGGNRSELWFRISDIFSPTYASRLKERGPLRYLVPVNPTPAPAPNRRIQGPAQRLEDWGIDWIRHHLDDTTEDGAQIPWAQGADEIELSTAKAPSRKTRALQNVLKKWVQEGRWVEKQKRWRPIYGWELLLKAKEGHVGSLRFHSRLSARRVLATARETKDKRRK